MYGKGMMLAVVLLAGALGGCAATVGAGAAGAAYEYQNQQALEELEKRFEQGEISKEEYLRRKKEIEGGSVVY